ncbi:MAG TPA: HPP family protein, partial [Candidatus Binataceae bacterium]|nr:HPP family protein [Candidatus Binataceae bacterium]
VLSAAEKRRLPTGEPRTDNAIDTIVAAPPRGRYWIPALFGFVLVALTAVKLTGLRFILFPPLVVIAFEMLGHPLECPWTRRPWLLPIACFLTAAGGLLCLKLMAFGPATAACSMGLGIVVLRGLKIHVPPALAVGLLPMVMHDPGPAYPFSVLIGTTAITLWFLAYRRWSAADSRLGIC